MENKYPTAGAPAPRSDGSMGNEIPQLPSWFIFVRYAQIVLTLIVFVCSCVAVGQLHGYYGFGWGAGFSLFASIWTFFFLAGVLLIPVFAPQLYFKWFCLGAEAVTVLWWLISFSGLATWAGLLSGVEQYGDSPLKTIYGACAAGAAFGAFNWIAFCVTLVFYAIGCHRHRVSKMGFNNRGVETGSASMGPIGVQSTPTPQPTYAPTPEPTGYGYQHSQQQYPTVPTPVPPQGYQQ